MKFATFAILLLTSACGTTIVERQTAVRPVTIVPDSGDLLGVGGGATPPAAMPIVTTPNDESFARLLNGVRASNGVDDVGYDARLDAAAQAHAQDMVDNGYFSHVSRDGRRFGERINDAGYEYSAAGEAITGGRPTEQVALDSWVNSPPHNDILNGERFEDFGLGVAGSGSSSRWVLVMAVEK